MVSDKRKSFIKFVSMWMWIIAVIVAAVAVAVGDEYMSQNVKKVVCEKGDACMNSVVYIIVIAIVCDK